MHSVVKHVDISNQQVLLVNVIAHMPALSVVLVYHSIQKLVARFLTMIIGKFLLIAINFV